MNLRSITILLDARLVYRTLKAVEHHPPSILVLLLLREASLHEHLQCRSSLVLLLFLFIDAEAADDSDAHSSTETEESRSNVPFDMQADSELGLARDLTNIPEQDLRQIDNLIANGYSI